MMYAYTSSIEVPAGRTLAGYAPRIAKRTSASGRLEVHSIGCGGAKGWELCSVDALYPGVLADLRVGPSQHRVVAASHTHFAPMLDDKKPALGAYCTATASEFVGAIESAERHSVTPTMCTVFRGEVALPIYRRFDFPGSPVARILTRFAGMYPNESYPIDRGVYVFVFSSKGIAQFTMVYHACHPVTRHESTVASADYIRALRQAVFERFRTPHCLFLQGCAGDVRPNFAQKRLAWLRRGHLNWRFRSSPTFQDQERADIQYRDGVLNAAKLGEFSVAEADFQLTCRKVQVHGLGLAEIPQLAIADRITFSFAPFEVSHGYHLDLNPDPTVPSHLLVSCCGNTCGYLPHASQLRFGGYEVDDSRRLMGIKRRIWVDEAAMR